jgi:hypothetical protein
MHTRHRALAASSIALFVCGCEPLSSHPEGRDDAIRYQLSARTIELLESADRMEILALGDPPRDGAPAPRGELFDGRPIMGRARLQGYETRDVVRGLYRAVAGATGVGLCFSPHHGLRVHAGEETLDISICYGCSQLKILGRPYRFVAIDPDVLPGVLDVVIEEQADLRFVTAHDLSPFGGWTSLRAGPGVQALRANSARPPREVVDEVDLRHDTHDVGLIQHDRHPRGVQ